MGINQCACTIFRRTKFQISKFNEPDNFFLESEPHHIIGYRVYSSKIAKNILKGTYHKDLLAKKVHVSKRPKLDKIDYIFFQKRTLDFSKNRRTLEKNKENFKIAIYGPSESGKTTFAIKFTKNKVSKFYIPSVFPEVIQSTILIENETQNFLFVIPTREEQTKIIQADSYFIFFDLNDKKSFNEARSFLVNYCKFLNNPVYLIGNKCDINTTVPEKEISKLCSKVGTKFFKISAQKGFGVIDLVKYASHQSYIENKNEDLLSMNTNQGNVDNL